jgi:hypothetical protein
VLVTERHCAPRIPPVARSTSPPAPPFQLQPGIYLAGPILFGCFFGFLEKKCFLSAVD